MAKIGYVKSFILELRFRNYYLLKIFYLYSFYRLTEKRRRYFTKGNRQATTSFASEDAKILLSG